VLEDGTRVAVKAVAVGTREEAERMLEYLRRLASYGNPALVPIRGAEYREGTLLVISEFDQGTPLRQLMERSPLSASQVVAIGLDVLTGLQALQQLGLSHGNLHASNVHLSRQGRARLADYALKPRFRPESSRLGWPDPRADLSAAGVLFCSALGISPRSETAELEEAERSVPALVAAVRVMAEGGAGRFAGAALGLFEEAAGNRARPTQLERTRQELSVLVGEGGRPLPPARPASSSSLPPAGMVAERVPLPSPGRDARRRTLLLAALGLLVALLVVLVGAWALLKPPSARVSNAALTPQARPSQAASSGSTTAPAPSVAASPPAASAPTQEAAAPTAAPGEGAAAPVPAEAPAQPVSGPASGGAGSPTGAVASFYDRVTAHDFGAAVALWTARMQSAYPPGENINSRFSNTTSMTLQRDEVISTGGGRAVVAIDLLEVRGGRTYHWVGNWYLVQTESGWLLDRPGLRPA
jgi:protein tyrosine kinase